MNPAAFRDIMLRGNRVGYCLMVFVLLCTGSHAQDEGANGPARLLSRFKFEQLTGGVVVIKAGLDNYSDSLQFILDTGSGGISLDSTTCLELEIATTPSNRTVRGLAGIKKLDFAYGHTLKLPGLDVENLDFHINDYQLLSGAYGTRVDGVIGYSFFRRYIVSINYEDKVIEVYQPGSFRYPRGGLLLTPALAGIPVQPAWLGENTKRRGRFYIDTGAGLNLLLSNQYVSDSSLFAAGKKRYPAIAEGLGGKREMEIAVLKSVKLGKYKFKNVPVYLFDDEFNITSYPYLGGVIGNDILRRFQTVINYPAGEIHLRPNNQFNEPFDYSFTGLGLIWENNSIVVSDVIAKSPAEAAGLQVGDKIIALDNNLSNSILAYRTILQQTGKRMKILLLRENELIQTYMQIQTIKK